MALYIPADGDLLTATEFRNRAGEGGGQPGDRSLASMKPLGEVGEFTPIGINKPLTIQIAHVYTGRHPGTGFFGGDRKLDLLVTSAIKSYAHYDAAPRAVNFFEEKIGPRTDLTAPAASRKGTPVVFYAPAVTDASLTLTLDISFNNYPDELLNKLSGAFGSLASLPIFLPYAGYLMIGGGIMKLAADIGGKLFEGQPDFTSTVTLDFDLPGHARPEAAFRIVAGSALDVRDLRFEPRRGLVHKSDPARLYQGEEPYLVISLDGKARADLAQFTPTLASAELLSTFISSTNKGEAMIDGLVEAARLANDSKYRLEADRLERDIAAAQKKGDAKEVARLTERRDAVIKNISSELLRPAEQSGGEEPSNASPKTEGGDEPKVQSLNHDEAAVAEDDTPTPAGADVLDAARSQKPWRVAKSLLKLRDQINAKYPRRSKTSDGTIGDEKHRKRSSDHNPWIDGGSHDIVSAIDITHDPANGCDCNKIYQALAAHKDPRVKYIIWDHHITNTSQVGTAPPWAKRPYSGPNPHTKHLHLSVKPEPTKFDSSADWQL
jgi:hypothetical protein